MKAHGPIRVILLMPSVFGQVGGIAQYCRDLVSGLTGDSRFSPLAGSRPKGWIETKELSLLCIEIDKTHPFAAAAHITTVLVHAADLIICAHRDLLPLGVLLARTRSALLVLVVYGIDVWQSPGPFLLRLVSQADAVITISTFTRDRMNTWARLPLNRYHLLPCGIDVAGIGQTNTRRVNDTPRVMITLGRLDSRERYKGVDEVLEMCPRLFATFPDLEYRIIGDGDDRPRLEAKARDLGLGQRVKFIGQVNDEQKAQEFRLADAFVMPGRGEGFGIVYLEAMAFGVPVVASCLDGSKEAVLDGEIGFLSNPNDPENLFQTVCDALQAPKQVPPALAHFSMSRFRCRLLGIVRGICEVVP